MLKFYTVSQAVQSTSAIFKPHWVLIAPFLLEAQKVYSLFFITIKLPSNIFWTLELPTLQTCLYFSLFIHIINFTSVLLSVKIWTDNNENVCFLVRANKGRGFLGLKIYSSQGEQWLLFRVKTCVKASCVSGISVMVDDTPCYSHEGDYC